MSSTSAPFSLRWPSTRQCSTTTALRSGPFLESTGRSAVCDIAPGAGAADHNNHALLHDLGEPSDAGSDAGGRRACRLQHPGVDGKSDAGGQRAYRLRRPGGGVLHSHRHRPIAAYHLTDVKLVDPQATSILPVSLQDGSVRIGPAPTATPTLTVTPGPSPTPTLTPTATNTAVPTLTPTFGPSPTPTSTPTLTPTPGPITVRIAPASQQAPMGQQFVVNVAIDNVVNLGAFQFTLNFNPGVLRYVSTEMGPFLTSTGRVASCPISDSGQGIVRLGCITYGAKPAGPSGSGILATITFQPISTGHIAAYACRRDFDRPYGQPDSGQMGWRGRHGHRGTNPYQYLYPGAEPDAQSVTDASTNTYARARRGHSGNRPACPRRGPR